MDSPLTDENSFLDQALDSLLFNQDSSLGLVQLW